jgi:hypothetical protein
MSVPVVPTVPSDELDTGTINQMLIGTIPVKCLELTLDNAVRRDSIADMYAYMKLYAFAHGFTVNLQSERGNTAGYFYCGHATKESRSASSIKKSRSASSNAASPSAGSSSSAASTASLVESSTSLDAQLGVLDAAIEGTGEVEGAKATHTGCPFKV